MTYIRHNTQLIRLLLLYVYRNNEEKKLCTSTYVYEEKEWNMVMVTGECAAQNESIGKQNMNRSNAQYKNIAIFKRNARKKMQHAVGKHVIVYKCEYMES